MQQSDEKTLYEIIALLTEKLGGHVVLTRDDITNPPVAVCTVDQKTDTLTIKLI